VEKQLVRILIGDGNRGSCGPLAVGKDPVIVLAHDLTPSETAQLDTQTVHAFATESGGPTSHTAIMAGALEIPAVVGIGRFLPDVTAGETVIVDGRQGLLIIDPDPATLAKYEAERAAQRAARAPETLIELPAVTKDGARVTLTGNIEFPSEAGHCLDRGAEGVGLYRTEFLYINKTTDPTEEEHFEAYKAVLAAMGPNRPVVIRTLDVGADKFSPVSGQVSGEKNPFLGLRSVRLCLKNLDLFKTQLRAVLRASVFGDLRVMFPMVSTVMELRQCRSLLLEAREDLEEEGIPFNPDVPIGTMIEVPSAALIADVLAKEVDFFSIGTNDLVQYTLAADRNNENVAGLYDPADPAVLRLIKMVVEAGRNADIEVNVCGEMSGEAIYTPLLVGLGIRHLSATPRKLPDVKRAIRALTVADAERVAGEALRMETAREVTTYLREQLRRFLPDATD
jgi:phosphotransferase system enzyme I (PtsI)